MEVAFGESKDKYRSEMITFEVVKLQSPYHALLGRPAFARFMARPCYTYLQLKMPSLNGVITIHGNREIAAQCDSGDAAMAEQACAEEELKLYKSQVNPDDGTILKKPMTDEKAKFKSAEDTKLVNFTPGDHSKQFVMGTHLTDK